MDLNRLAEDGAGHDMLKSKKGSNGILSTNPDDKHLENKSTVRCVACKPGFKASYATKDGKVIANFIFKCVDMNDGLSAANKVCEDNSLWFNGCSQCSSGKVFGYKNGKGVQYDQCIEPVPATNKSCYAYDGDNKKCVYCKKGTYMNDDNQCEIIHPPKCKFRKFSFGGYFEEHDFLQGLGYESSELGCTECEEGYVSVYQPEQLHMCTHSMYHQTGNFAALSKYIENCLNYAYDEKNVLVCKKCKENFAISPKGRCFSSATGAL